MMIKQSQKEHPYIQQALEKERLALDNLLKYMRKYLDIVAKYAWGHPNRDRILQLIIKYKEKFKDFSRLLDYLNYKNGGSISGSIFMQVTPNMLKDTYSPIEWRNIVNQLQQHVNAMELVFEEEFGHEYYYGVIVPQLQLVLKDDFSEDEFSEEFDEDYDDEIVSQ